jgi:hypothetical protein
MRKTRGGAAIEVLREHLSALPTGVIAAEVCKTRPDVAKPRALVAASTMIGAVTMSRIVTDSEVSASILREAKKQLLNSR